MSAERNGGFMLEFVKAFRDAFGIESTWGFIGTVAVVAAIVAAFLAWVVDSAYRNATAVRRPEGFLECQMTMAPTVLPPDGRLWAIQLWPSEIQSGLGQYFGQPGAPIALVPPLPAGSPPQAVYECRLTNEGTTPVFDVGIVLSTAFGNAADGTTDAELGGWREWPIGITRVDSGSPFVFYILNFSNRWVSVKFPDTFTGRVGGTDASTTMSLRTNVREKGIVFPPKRTG